MPLSTFIRRLDTGERVDVIGVGTVRLPTKASPHLPSSASHTTLFLQRVLHAPNLQVNLIGQTGLENWKAVPRDYDGHTCGYIYDSTNKPVAFFKPTAPPGVFEVRISGPPVGPPVGKRPSHLLVYNHNLSHYWFPGERKSVEAWLDIRDRNFAIDGPLTKMELAWLAACFGDKFPVMKELGSNMFRAIFRNEARVILRDLASCSDSHPSLPPGSELLTPIELRWFTDRYGAMFKALGARGVRLFRPEYQAEGRSILRTIMYNDGFNFSSDSASQQSATTPSHDEQVWLKMQSKDFDKFLSEHALIMYNDEDRNEGLCILRSLMRDNGDLDSESSSNRNNILAEKLVRMSCSSLLSFPIPHTLIVPLLKPQRNRNGFQ